MRRKLEPWIWGLFGLFLFSFSAGATPCSSFWNNTLPVPGGFGASYDVFSSNNSLISVDCSSLPNVILTVGTENSATQAIYNTAYLSKDGSTWTAIALGSTNNVIPNGYFQASATGTLNLTSGDLANWNYIAFLVAYYRNGAWVYGCVDTTCRTPGWNLQAITQATYGPNINIDLSTVSFLVPATAGSNIAKVLPSETFGSNVPTVALSTAGGCSGSPSTDNGSFALSGLNLNVGGSNITSSGSFNICFSGTDATAANSPLYQPFTLNSSSMASITSVQISTSNFITPAAAGTTIANLSATTSAGSFLGQIQFSTLSTCAGSPSADNSKFSLNGSALKIAQGPSLTAGTYDVCFAATGSYSNSPFYQSFSLTGTGMVMPAVPVSISPSMAGVFDNAAIGSTVTGLTTITSDGSAFSGTMALTSNPGNLFAIGGSAPNYLLTVGASGPGSDGNHTVTAQATENSTSINQNITVNVMPSNGVVHCDIGPDWNGPIPGPALAYGFTTCLNFDFRYTGTFTNAKGFTASNGQFVPAGQTYQWSNMSSWLNSAGSSNPIYQQISDTSAAFNIVNDGGTQALMTLFRSCCGFGPQIVGPWFPTTNAFVEEEVKLDPTAYYQNVTSAKNGETIDDFGFFAPPPGKPNGYAAMETDGGLTCATNGVCAGNGSFVWSADGQSATGQPSFPPCCGINIADGNYHTTAFLVVSSRTTNKIAHCAYSDQQLADSRGFGPCWTPSFEGGGLGDACTFQNSAACWQMGDYEIGSYVLSASSDTAKQWVRRFTVWTCPGWNTPATSGPPALNTCDSGNITITNGTDGPSY